MRITPAYAGNTFCFCAFSFQIQDHPRLRGEHLTGREMYIRQSGSPPPTRGTLFVVMMNNHHFRITPAYAGNTQP